MNKVKYSCLNCKEEFTTNNLDKHHDRCIVKGGRYTLFNKLPEPESLNCPHCDKVCKNTNSLRQHSVRCGKNPDRIHITNNLASYVSKLKSGEIEKLNVNQWSNPNFKLSPETAKKSIEAKTKNGTLNHSEEHKKKMSSIMKQAVEEHPESYTSSNRGRTKQIEKYGLKFQGNWELLYYEWCIANSINVVRCPERFLYEWNGERSYNPDFYLPDSNTYVEVKGYETDRDRAKWKYFPHQLTVIRKKEIEEIKRFFKASSIVNK